MDGWMDGWMQFSSPPVDNRGLVMMIYSNGILGRGTPQQAIEEGHFL